MLLGVSWGPLGGNLGRLGDVLGRLGGVFGGLGCVLSVLGVPWGGISDFSMVLGGFGGGPTRAPTRRVDCPTP